MTLSAGVLPSASPATATTAAPTALLRYCGFSLSPARVPAAARLRLQQRHRTGPPAPRV